MEGVLLTSFFLYTFKRLDISPKLIKPHLEPLINFVGGQVRTNGVIELETTFGVGKLFRTLLVQYVLIDANTSYNILIG